MITSPLAPLDLTLDFRTLSVPYIHLDSGTPKRLSVSKASNCKSWKRSFAILLWEISCCATH